MEFGSLRDLRLKGIAKFLHGLFMLITYPLRHFFKFLLFVLLLLLIVLLLMPLSKGVKLTQIPQWYEQKFEHVLKNQKEKLITSKEDIVESKPQELMKFQKEIKLKHAKVQTKKQEVVKEVERETKIEEINEKIPRYAAWNIQKQEPVEQKQAKEEKAQPSDVPVQEEVAEEPQKEDKPIISFKKLDTLSLIYLENPEVISGQAKISGPNELVVKDTFLYLYGIYTNPSKYNVDEATAYLEELLNESEIECHIVAKTLDDVATAICIRDGLNINQNLVDVGLADNVAL